MAKTIHSTNIMLALSGLYHARFYQKSVELQQNNLLKTNKQQYEEQTSLETSGDRLNKQVLQNLGIDLDLTTKLSEEIKQSKANPIFPLKTNKMLEVLIGAQAIFNENQENIVKIASGVLPKNYDNATSKLTQLDDGQYYGSSQSSFVSGCILSTNFTLTQSNINSIKNLDSAITHAYPLPSDITAPEGYRFSYKDNSFATIHSGYAFGGGLRSLETYYPKGKTLAPEDCGSFLDRLINPKAPLNTADLLCIYRNQVGGGFIPEGWDKTPIGSTCNLYKPVTKLEDIQIGDIYVHRGFNNTNTPQNSLGISGHTAIIVDLPTKEGMVKTVGAARNMPTLEGIGIQNFSIISTPQKEAYILRLNEYDAPATLPFKFSNLHESFDNLPNTLEYFDQLIGQSLSDS